MSSLSADFNAYSRSLQRATLYGQWRKERSDPSSSDGVAPSIGLPSKASVISVSDAGTPVSSMSPARHLNAVSSVHSSAKASNRTPHQVTTERTTSRKFSKPSANMHLPSWSRFAKTNSSDFIMLTCHCFAVMLWQSDWQDRGFNKLSQPTGNSWTKKWSESNCLKHWENQPAVKKHESEFQTSILQVRKEWHGRPVPLSRERCSGPVVITKDVRCQCSKSNVLAKRVTYFLTGLA